MIASVDTETTGLDLHHGARPFFVTCCKDDGEQLWWDWAVDPLTREVAVPESDLDEVRRLLEEAELLVLHNSKFDASALKVVGIDEFPWWKVRDTLLAAHLLGSNQPKNLTDLCAFWLGRNIQPCEDALEEATKACRRQVQQARLRVKRGKETDEPLASWRIASENEPDMPSAGKETWKYDSWLPKVIDPASTVLEEYANTDSSITLLLWQRMEREIHKRGLWALYEERLKALPIAFRMEQEGVTINLPVAHQLKNKYSNKGNRCAAVCVNLAKSYGYDLTLPKGSVNDSLRNFCFDVLKLEPRRNPKAKTNAPALNKEAIAYYLETLDFSGKPYRFVRNLMDKRKGDTQVQFLNSYEKFGRPVADNWLLLHPNLNITGTDTLRWSSERPNSQNVSKQETECRRCEGEGCDECDGTGQELDSLRLCFGPAPGREWYSMDGKNLELRLPAFECGEEELIALFEKPDEPPYYGSEHLLNFSTVYPDLWEQELKAVGYEKVGPHCKKKYASTWYQRCKNGGFSVGYGSVDRPDGLGTADRTFGRPGSHARLKTRFAKKEKLNQHWIAYAERMGYVETIPDKTVDPQRGYPLLVSRTEYGRIKPTVPLNYHIQGSACWWIMKAMIRCQEQLDYWRRQDGFDGRIVMQIHDELVFDFPKASRSLEAQQKSLFRRSGDTLWRAKVLQGLMSLGGDDFGIPTPASCEFHAESWAKGVTV